MDEPAAVEMDAVGFYPDHEFNVDLFGTYTDHDRFGNNVDSGGGGLGLSYFFTRHIGIGTDTYLEEGRWPYRSNGSLILRLPVGEGPLAVYALGGGGRQFRFVPQYMWHGGAGLEYRLSMHTGIFADARRVFPDTTADYTLVRAGLRFAF